ncbi:MAG: VWA domain-containing protein [Planctomycetaceae bacterium]
MFGLLNFAMLAGLAGLALPLLAHLLSKRKFDVVNWGAMQFLELGHRTRRRIRMEELLLLLLRMLLMALLVLAVSRFWVGGALGSLFSAISQGPSRDVVIVIDGSYSMGWEGRNVTPHARAIQWIHEYLEELRPGDTVSLLDARDQVRSVIEPSTSDLDEVRKAIDQLPKPSGSSRLPSAIGRAVQILNKTTNLRRDIVLLTDGQQLPWDPENVAAWLSVDALREEASVKPKIWFVNVAGRHEVDPINFSVDTLQLSRELTVPEFSIRVRTTVRQSGGAATRRKVYFEVDGQRIVEKTLDVTMPPNGEATVEFVHRFSAVGSYVLSVVLDSDNLPGDNRADAAVVITEGIPALLVDGTPNADPVLRETFYAQAALSPKDVDGAWVKARVVDAPQLKKSDLEGQQAVFLCNIPRLTPEQADALREYVDGGGGVIIAPGDQTSAQAWNELYADGNGLLPAPFDVIASEEDVETAPVRILNDSLLVPWLLMFRHDSHEGGFDFTEVRFSKWWKLTPPEAKAEPAAADQPVAVVPDVNNVPAQGPASQPLAAAPVVKEVETRLPPLVVARLSTGAPYAISQSYGRGRVIQLAAPLDDQWSTLPGRRALAPLLHELVFSLAGSRSGRNVDSGSPLLIELTSDDNAADFQFVGPEDREYDVEPSGDELHPMFRLSDTSLAGNYRLQKKTDPTWTPQRFVVNFDRTESNLTVLSDVELTKLQEDDRLSIISTVAEIREKYVEEAPKQEIWYIFLVGVLCFMILETYLTRRLVQGGHEAVAPAMA